MTSFVFPLSYLIQPVCIFFANPHISFGCTSLFFFFFLEDNIFFQIILRLPDDTEVSNELWDDVIECLRLRVGDKVPLIRTFAVRGLSRFLNDSENMDVLDLLLEVLPLEQNAVSFPTLSNEPISYWVLILERNIIFLEI